MPTIPENLRTIQKRMADACARVGRPSDAARLIAVTKTRPVEDLPVFLREGQCALGENRVAPFLEKQAALADASPAVEWHFIGHLQSRKVKDLAGKTVLIHSVDRLKIAEKLQRVADEQDTTERFLLEVNVSGEEAKFGIAPEMLERVTRDLASLDRVRCLGLMTMAPWVDDPEETRCVFRGLRQCLERLRDLGMEHLELRHLSMGMTNDFEVAIEEGATLVRVGTALFA